jgi:Family of unknown function (DUF6308)
MPVRAELFRIVLRHGIEVENALEPTLEFLDAYPGAVADAASPTESFGEEDLRRANRGGARISAAEIAAVRERKYEIEPWLQEIPPDSSLAGAARSIPWRALTGLFEAFSAIRGIGLSKVTKTLHPKRPALIPMLDSVVQAYLEPDDLGNSEPFAERATALVRSYKGDLDHNRGPLLGLQRELARRGYQLTEVRILDILIWSVFADRAR